MYRAPWKPSSPGWNIRRTRPGQSRRAVDEQPRPRPAASPRACRDRRRASARRARRRTSRPVSSVSGQAVHVGAEQDRRAGPGALDGRHDRADASCRATARGRDRGPPSATIAWVCGQLRGRPRGSGADDGAARPPPGGRPAPRQARDVRGAGRVIARVCGSRRPAVRRRLGERSAPVARRRALLPVRPSDVLAGGRPSPGRRSRVADDVGDLGRIGHAADIGRLIRASGVAERRDVAGCRAVRRADRRRTRRARSFPRSSR